MALSPGFIEIDGHVLGIEFWKDYCKYVAKPIDDKTVEIRMTKWKDGGPDVIGIIKIRSMTVEKFCEELKKIADKYAK